MPEATGHDVGNDIGPDALGTSTRMNAIEGRAIAGAWASPRQHS